VIGSYLYLPHIHYSPHLEKSRNIESLYIEDDHKSTIMQILKKSSSCSFGTMG